MFTQKFKARKTFKLHFKSLLKSHIFSSFKDVRDRKILHTDVFKVQYIIIQAILSRKSMKKFTVSFEKNIPCLLTVKNNSHTDLRISHAQRLEKGYQYREEH